MAHHTEGHAVPQTCQCQRLCACGSKQTIHILSTNVHWRNSLVGFRRFTPQSKIQSYGSASSAYARRRSVTKGFK